MEPWLHQELTGYQFADERLGWRFSMVLKQLADEETAESIPLACQDWANTKAAHRFFANERVSEARYLGGTFSGGSRASPISPSATHSTLKMSAIENRLGGMMSLLYAG